MSVTSDKGRKGEDIVCRWLCANGYHIVDRNYWIRGGDLDIIAENEMFLVFVEVKTRNPHSMISGLDAVTRKKKQHLIRTAAIWISDHSAYMTLQKRFDVACVTLHYGHFEGIDYYENAFDITGTNYLI